MFTDRRDAGQRLAKRLAHSIPSDAIVLALPRGGVVLGYEIATRLDLPLDIVTVRKIGLPGNPEFAVGAVDERGTTLLDQDRIVGIDARWLKRETAVQKQEAQRRARLYRGTREALELKNKTALLVDDGVATGLSMRLAVQVVRAQGAKRVVIAVPVATEDSIHLLASSVDEVVVLASAEDFLGAVGLHYIHFDQVEDDEVIRLLESAYASRRSDLA